MEAASGLVKLLDKSVQMQKLLCHQWRFQSSQVTRGGDMRGVCGKLMGGEKFGPSP